MYISRIKFLSIVALFFNVGVCAPVLNKNYTDEIRMEVESLKDDSVSDLEAAEIACKMVKWCYKRGDPEHEMLKWVRAFKISSSSLPKKEKEVVEKYHDSIVKTLLVSAFHCLGEAALTDCFNSKRLSDMVETLQIINDSKCKEVAQAIERVVAVMGTVSGKIDNRERNAISGLSMFSEEIYLHISLVKLLSKANILCYQELNKKEYVSATVFVDMINKKIDQLKTRNCCLIHTDASECDSGCNKMVPLFEKLVHKYKTMIKEARACGLFKMAMVFKQKGYLVSTNVIFDHIICNFEGTEASRRAVIYKKQL